MPFRSEKQRRFLWKFHPDIARRWTKKYGSKIVKPKKKRRCNEMTMTSIIDAVLVDECDRKNIEKTVKTYEKKVIGKNYKKLSSFLDNIMKSKDSPYAILPVVESIENDIKSIRESSGKAKLDALRDITGDEAIFKEILYYAYNPYIKFFVVKIPDLKFSGNKKINQKTWSHYKQILDMLSSRKITGNKAVETAREFLSEFSPESGEILANILKKDLRIGVDVATINKVYPGLIPVFGVMLAKKYGSGSVDPEKDDFKLPWSDTYVSRKLDGLRLVAIKENGSIDLRSRSGKQYPHFDEIRKQLGLLPVDNVVFDGEVVVMDENEADDFSKIASMARTKNASDLDHKAIYVIFDLIPLEEFKSNRFSTPMTGRFSKLVSVFGVSSPSDKKFIIGTKYPNLFIVNQIKVDTSEKFRELFLFSQERGWEGLMIRKGSSPYEVKRSSTLQKVKAFMDEEFPIVGYFEGQGKYKGKLGGFIVQINKKGDRVEVGSGYTDEERERFWKNRDKMVGKMMTVKFKHYSKDKYGNESLNFPIYKGIGREEVE